MDKLNWLLPEANFKRLYQRVKEERAALEKKVSSLEQPTFTPAQQNKLAKELVRQFVESPFTSREALCSLIEKVELTQDKRVIIRYRFRDLERTG